MLFSDYHIHSKFSGDSKEDVDKILEKSISLGLKEIAITDQCLAKRLFTPSLCIVFCLLFRLKVESLV